MGKLSILQVLPIHANPEVGDVPGGPILSVFYAARV